jgi:hypothetical protein
MTNKIIITRNGETRVYTGWRAWLMGAAAFVVTFAVLALVTFILLGIAASIGALLLLLVPAAIVMAALAWAVGGARPK